MSINNDATIICELFIKMLDKLFVGKKPPEETTVIAKFKELNDLTLKRLKVIKITKVIRE